MIWFTYLTVYNVDWILCANCFSPLELVHFFILLDKYGKRKNWNIELSISNKIHITIIGIKLLNYSTHFFYFVLYFINVNCHSIHLNVIEKFFSTFTAIFWDLRFHIVFIWSVITIILCDILKQCYSQSFNANMLSTTWNMHEESIMFQWISHF